MKRHVGKALDGLRAATRFRTDSGDFRLEDIFEQISLNVMKFAAKELTLQLRVRRTDVLGVVSRVCAHPIILVKSVLDPYLLPLLSLTFGAS